MDRPVARRARAPRAEVAQGHPKLLELADGQAAHPDGCRAARGWRPGVAAGRPAGRVLHRRGDARNRQRTTCTSSPPGPTPSPRRCGRRAGSVLVPVLPGRTRPPTGHAGPDWADGGTARPRRPALRAGPGAGRGRPQGLAAVRAGTEDDRVVRGPPLVAATGRTRPTSHFKTRSTPRPPRTGTPASGTRQERQADGGGYRTAGTRRAGALRYLMRQQDWGAGPRCWSTPSRTHRGPTRRRSCPPSSGSDPEPRGRPLAVVLGVLDPRRRNPDARPPGRRRDPRGLRRRQR